MTTTGGSVGGSAAPDGSPRAGDGGPTPVSASRSTLSRIMTSRDVNLLGTVHGGVVMKLVDDAAGVAAARHSRGNAVTAAMDEMVFLRPVRIGDLVHVHAQVNWAGRTSMEVGVRVTAERWNETAPADHVASAYLVFVAVDERGNFEWPSAEGGGFVAQQVSEVSVDKEALKEAVRLGKNCEVKTWEQVHQDAPVAFVFDLIAVPDKSLSQLVPNSE